MTAPIAAYATTRSGPPRADATLEKMVEITMREYEMPVLVEVAVAIAVTAREKDTGAITTALLRWLRMHTRFVPDPVGQQMLKTPVYMLEVMRNDPRGIVGGDCVDVAMLAASLAMAVGLTARFVAEAYPIGNACMGLLPPLVHVYAIVQTQTGWVMLDTQRPPGASTVETCRQVIVPIP